MAFLRLMTFLLFLGAPALVQSAQVASCGGCTFSTDTAGNLTRSTCDPASCTGTLYLSSKSIISLDQGVFSGLQITTLYLNNNQISVLPEGLFAGLSSLSWLDLSNNQISVLPEGLFAGLSSLTGLGLHNNQISVLPEGLFAGLSSLQYLGLHNNQISVLPEGLFAGLSFLQYLYLNNNQISVLPEGLFAGLSSLSTLSLHNNPLVCRLDFPVAPMNFVTGAQDTSYNDLELCKNPGLDWNSSSTPSSQYPWETSDQPGGEFYFPDTRCSESRDWQMLKQGGPGSFVSGGMGQLAVPGIYEVWICIPNHVCGASYNDSFCYVWGEMSQKFHPWGRNSVLSLCP